MERRTTRRQERIALAERLAARLNAATGKQAKAIRRLATEKPRTEYVPSGTPGVVKPGGYSRSVITALRRYGRATLYWFAKARSYRAKVDRSVKGASERRLLLDAFVKAGNDAVSRCACGAFYARRDGRQRFCSIRCADRDRQRRARTRRRATRPEAHAAFVESAARRAAERQRVADWMTAQPVIQEQIDRARDILARREQRRLRNETM